MIIFILCGLYKHVLGHTARMVPLPSMVYMLKSLITYKNVLTAKIREVSIV